MTIDPVKVVNSVGGLSYATAVNAGINVPRPIPVQQPVINNTPHLPQVVQPIEDPNQLTFDFDKSSYAKSIFDHLDAINNKLTRIENVLNTLK